MKKGKEETRTRALSRLELSRSAELVGAGGRDAGRDGGLVARVRACAGEVRAVENQDGQLLHRQRESQTRTRDIERRCEKRGNEIERRYALSLTSTRALARLEALKDARVDGGRRRRRGRGLRGRLGGGAEGEGEEGERRAEVHRELVFTLSGSLRFR